MRHKHVFSAKRDVDPGAKKNGLSRHACIGLAACAIGIILIKEIGKIRLDLEKDDMEETGANKPGSHYMRSAVAPPFAKPGLDAITDF